MKESFPITPTHEPEKEIKESKDDIYLVIHTDEKTGKQRLTNGGVEPLSKEYHRIKEVEHGGKTVFIGSRGAENFLLIPSDKNGKPDNNGKYFRESSPYQIIEFDKQTGKLVVSRVFGGERGGREYSVLDPETGEVLEIIDNRRTKIPPMEFKRSYGR